MNIYYASDLHNEDYRKPNKPFPELIIPDDVDVIVLAGDIDEKTHGVTFANGLSEKYRVPIIYVPGNHEYWRTKYPGNLAKMKLLASEHVHVADNEVVVIGDTRFICATLWTDAKLFGDDSRSFIMNKAQYGPNGMNDYKKIRLSRNYRKAAPIDFINAHIASRSFIEKTLNIPFYGDTVVVTHHAPLKDSIPESLRDDEMGAMYASDLRGLIERLKPTAWIHGHIHKPANYLVGETLVTSNPRGRDVETELLLHSQYLSDMMHAVRKSKESLNR